MAKNDFRRIKKLGKYLKREKKRLILILLILIPVALAGSIQPLLVGHPLSLRLDGGTLQEIINSIQIQSLIKHFPDGKK